MGESMSGVWLCVNTHIHLDFLGKSTILPLSYLRSAYERCSVEVLIPEGIMGLMIVKKMP
jgi:hypothetical protein